jgi:hypothetical protein
VLDEDAPASKMHNTMEKFVSSMDANPSNPMEAFALPANYFN